MGGMSSLRVGVVFPGQGSQSVGMGVDIAAHSNTARALFERSGEILGYDLLALQRQGPDERLRETQYSQPAIFATNVALYAAVGASLAPIVSAGHSFGEICSLYAAQSLTFHDALRIVAERAKAMQAAADEAPGGMSAVLGLEADAVRTVAQKVATQTRARVQLANFNAPTQIVISGDLAAVQAAGEAMLAAGAKRVIPLNVSGAWHSALMDPAVERFRSAVDSVEFSIPKFDVISNVDARPYRDTESMRVNLVHSITREVLWHATAEALLSYKLDLIVEFGASAVLGPLLRRMPGACLLYTSPSPRDRQKSRMPSSA